MNDINKQLIDFISASPSAYHTVESVRRELDAAGYTELFEGDEWSVTAPGKYYVRRNGSSIIARACRSRISAASWSWPRTAIRRRSRSSGTLTSRRPGMYTMLNVEKYGGMLCSTWLDRPLSVAGRAIVAEGGRMVSRLVNVDRDLAVIPNVAIHMDRSANDGKSYNANVDIFAAHRLRGAENRLQGHRRAEPRCRRGRGARGRPDPLPARTRLRLGRGERVRLLRTA